ncbi:MAG: ABC transporter ATP-binding protein [Phycisphaeraceae bacterium]|nr:ABC transporter ATP-binding protein [Phycisphaerales bacterium]QOJ18979.1 MAG: ABC transporter ATP-binding protein [Phycisphaeraceae bacterium]
MASRRTENQGEPVIRVENVVKRFDEQTVLDGVSFDVYRGETMVIMGGSGSGKSTLLRLMIGSLQPDGGRILLFGQDLSTLSEHGLDELRRRFGILFQSGALFQSMTIGENVALPLQEHTMLDQNIIDIQVKIYLNQVGLYEHADKYPAQISGGMKKRAGLARALALDPEIVFYDEPSAGLDPVTSAEIDQLIIDVTKKLDKTSVVVTHEMDSAFRIADRMAMLDRGRMLMVDTRDAFARLRDVPESQAASLSAKERLIRQFLRGDPHGPITERRELTNFAEELLGREETTITRAPAVEPTRVPM